MNNSKGDERAKTTPDKVVKSSRLLGVSFDEADALEHAENCFDAHFCGGEEGRIKVVNAVQRAMMMAYRFGKKEKQ